MHIPDGYLSPATCAVTFAAAAPFWYLAMRRIERVEAARTIPLIALVAAFSFVIMMFNLPVPGGTTAHATGLAIAAILLGPWAAVLAISVALLIQAVLFGDGGITAFGANCFNIAVVGPMLAYAVYRLVSLGAAVGSRRRVLAAGLAGYLGINAAALVTALEFGLQPVLFHDAGGAPLYAPYPLSVAVPAMAITHLTVAGIAEFVVTAGIVAWLQRANPDLLAPSEGAGAEAPGLAWLWGGLAALIALSPLGLLASGTAWGEWGAEDFTTPEGREAIASASGGVAPPETVPGGFERLSSFWSAPVPDYAPGFLQNETVGYLLSAGIGVGLVVAFVLVVARWRAGRARAA